MYACERPSPPAPLPKERGGRTREARGDVPAGFSRSWKLGVDQKRPLVESRSQLLRVGSL